MNTSEHKYWVAVVSKNHLMRGVEGGFMQVNHGKQQPLKKMNAGDGILFYSPKETFEGNEKLQAFTAIGEVADNQVYQHKMSDDFIPFRRNVNFKKAQEAPIQPLINQLQFIKNKQSWDMLSGLAFLR